MEKRLPLFLLFSFLILILWPVAFPPPERPAEAGEGLGDEVPPPNIELGAGDEVGPGGEPGPTVGPGEPEAAGDEVDASEPEPWRQTLSLGRPGQRGHYVAEFDNRGAVVANLFLDGYYDVHGLDEAAREDPAHWVQLLSEVHNRQGPLASFAVRAHGRTGEYLRRPIEHVLWEHEQIADDDGTPLGVRFTHDSGTGLSFEKTIRAVPDTYDLAFEFVVENSDPERAGGSATFVVTPAMGVPPSSSDGFYPEPKAGVSWREKNEYEVKRQARIYKGPKPPKAFPPRKDIAWAGVDNKYFAVLMRPLEGSATASALVGSIWSTYWDDDWVRDHPEELAQGYRQIATDVDLLVPLPRPGESSRLEFLVYAGPKEKKTLEEHGGDAFAKLAQKDLGFFSGIAGLLLRILGFFHGVVGNWGWSIILLTLSVRAALFPVNRRSQTAMARHATKMKRIQPKIDEVKAKYKKDPQKLRQEQARIMQEEGAFPPLGGCLPVFVQIPIFFGLFSALRSSFDLRQAPFMGWIHDLSAPDRMMRIDLNLPLLGTIEYLNVLPPLMVVLWIVQQRVMPKPTDEQALRMHKMMMWMPIMFGFFLYNYAAGLSLYMITTSVFGILEQTVIKKIWPIDDAEQPKKKSGFMSRLADLQKEAQKMQESQKHAKSQGRKGGQKGGQKGGAKGGGPSKARGKGRSR